MKMNKIYLVMEATGSWDDYMNVPTDAFESFDLAFKVSCGLQDAIHSAYDKHKHMKEEFSKRNDAIWSEQNDDLTEEQCNELTHQLDIEESAFWKSVGLDIDIFWNGLPTYSVKEIDLIN